MMDDANQRANGQFTGVVPLDVVAREGGLSVMQGILEGRLPGAAMARTLNFWLTKVEEGLIVFTGTPDGRASQSARHCSRRMGGNDHGFLACLCRDDDDQARRGLYDSGVQAQPDPADPA
jgi:hypothetical protein